MGNLNSAQGRLTAMLLLTTIFFVVEIIVGYITNSMALIADSFHMFSDAIALVIAFISVRMSPKKWSKNTFGWARAEVLGALVNAVFLCALCVSILIESIKRFVSPDPLHDPQLIMFVGGLGLFINLIGLLLFRGHHHHHHHHHHPHHHHHHHHHRNHQDHTTTHTESEYLVCEDDSHRANSSEPDDKLKYGLLCQSSRTSQDPLCKAARQSNASSPEHCIADNDAAGRQLTNKSKTSTSDTQPQLSSPSDQCHSHTKVNVGAQEAGVAFRPKAASERNHEFDMVEHRPTEVESEKRQQQPSNHQMNMHGVFLHVMADALGSVIVMISASVVMYTDWERVKLYIDPTLSVLMVCLILRSTWPLLTESAMILLQTVPTHIEVDSLRRRLTQEIPGVLAVHEFHVWQLAGDRIIASAHIRCHNLQDYMRIAEKVKEFFHNEGIHSTTIQPEFLDLENEVFNNVAGDNCVLDCPPTQRPHCAPQTCCGNQRNEPSGIAIEGTSGGGTDQAAIGDQAASLFRRISVARGQQFAGEGGDLGPTTREEESTDIMNSANTSV